MPSFPRFLSLALLLAAAAPAWADVDLAVANGDKVAGSLVPATEVEVLRIQLPEGALLTIVAKGKKPPGKASKGATAPTITFRVLDGTDTDIAAGLVTPKGATGAAVKKLEILATGEYRVEIRGDGTNAGDYQAKVKWKSPKKVVQEADVGPAEVPVPIHVDAGASATLTLKPARGSSALPRLLRIERVADDAIVPISQPDPASKSHKAKAVPLVAGGDYRVILGDVGAGGGAKLTAKLKPPKAGKRTIAITGDQVGTGAGDDRVIGAVVSATGGVVLIPPGDASGLTGAALRVPANAVPFPTALVIGSAPPISEGPTDDLRGAGPSVFFGPEGQTFATPVTVTLPINVEAFGGDFTSLVVVERDARGRTRIVPGPYDVDELAGTVSFAASHFTSYRAFGRLPPVASDLNDDGLPDLVYLDADGQVGEANRVRVVLGGDGLVTREIDARDILFQGTTANDFFGQALAVGDVNGDGVDDLLIGAQEASNTVGRIFIFFGGASFSGSLDAENEADVVLRGEGGLARIGTSIALGRFVGDDTLDVAIGTNDSTLIGFPEARVYEGGDALVSNAPPVVRITGPRSVLFASRVAAADVTGDGNDDLIVTSSFAGASQEGAVYVFFGGAGFASGAHTDADATLTGQDTFQRLGNAVAVGDVIGDGAADIVVGTSKFGTFEEDVYLFQGGAALATVTSAAAAVRISGTEEFTSDSFGAVLATGNVGGDAKDDLLIGDRFMPFDGGNPGGVAIYFGGTVLASVGLFDADAVITGADDRSFFGGVLSALDLTGDGVDEVISIASLVDLQSGLRGELYVFTGGSRFPVTADEADIILQGLNFGD